MHRIMNNDHAIEKTSNKIMIANRKEQIECIRGSKIKLFVIDFQDFIYETEIINSLGRG